MPLDISFDRIDEYFWAVAGPEDLSIRSLPSSLGGLTTVTITLDDASKSRLLSPGTSGILQIERRAVAHLARLRNIDAAVGELFGFKTQAVSGAPLRLLTSPETAQNAAVEGCSIRSFIALSYCWHNPEWKAEVTSTVSSGMVYPIATGMFEALLLEIEGPAEGVWIDQICICQSDEQEKTAAVGSMDVIYKSARLVVIVLEDITLIEDEETAVMDLVAKVQRRESWDVKNEEILRRNITGLYWKFFSSRWFTRAWCSHELHLSSKHVFLVGIKGSNRRYLRMSSSFLHALGRIVSHLDSVNIAQLFVQHKSAYRSRSVRFNRQLWAHSGYLRLSSFKEPDDYVVSYAHAFADISVLGSSIEADKLAIVLNILNCGLAFLGRTENAQECCRILTYLAIAAGDSTILSATGHSLRPGMSWLQWPTLTDVEQPRIYGTAIRPNYHLKLQSIPHFDDKAIFLDLLNLGTPHSPSATAQRKASWFINGSIALVDQTGLWLFDDAAIASPYFAQRKQRYIDTLACALDCGSETIASGYLLRIEGQTDKKLNLREAVEYFFDSEESRYNHPMKPLDDQSIELYLSLIEFIDALLGLWIQINKGYNWHPLWVETSGVPNRSLFLTPASFSIDSKEHCVVVPVVLAPRDYTFHSRLWTLVRATDDSCWKILGKTTSFGTTDFLTVAREGNILERQRIVS